MNDDIRNDINIFLSDGQVEKEILYILDRTKSTGNEYGFLFAIVDDEIVIGNIIEGEDNIVDIEREENFSDFIKHKKHGSIHTHPYMQKKKFCGAVPSGMDILYSLLYDEYFFLIATLVDNNIPTIYAFTSETMKETMVEVEEYLISIDEEHTRLDCANVISASMANHPESWENHMIIKEYK